MPAWGLRQTVMKIDLIHEWPDNPQTATDIQEKLKKDIIIEGSLDDVHLIAGVDTAFDHKRNLLFSGVALLRYPDMIEVEKSAAWGEATFPTFPGMQAFREGPVVLAALAQLEAIPDLIFFSGQGIAQPNRFGLACHLGLTLAIPSIGVARKKLAIMCGELDDNKGSQAPLLIGNQQVGVAYRSRSGVKPIFISPGHRCGIDDAVKLISGCLSEYRLPDPLHFAHRWANFTKRKGCQTALDEYING